MKLWANIIAHNHGVGATLATTFAEACEHSANWVREWWDDEFPDEDMPEDIDEAVEMYFEEVSHEYVDIVETELALPVVLVVNNRSAYEEITYDCGVEPFPYYNSQGGPHWAAFTEVDYRMEYIGNLEVPALRELLKDLSGRGVFGVIIVNKGYEYRELGVRDGQ